MPVEAPLGFTLQCDVKGIALRALGDCADNQSSDPAVSGACMFLNVYAHACNTLVCTVCSEKNGVVYEIHKSQRQHNPLSFCPLSLSQEILGVKSSLDFGAKCLGDSELK